MLNKIKTIALSRLKNQKEESWIRERRKLCAPCEYNTKNISTLKVINIVVKFFSDLYSFVTGNKNVDTLGHCSACLTCSIYYKTAEKTEYCPAKPSKWTRIK